MRTRYVREVRRRFDFSKIRFVLPMVCQIELNELHRCQHISMYLDLHYLTHGFNKIVWKPSKIAFSHVFHERIRSTTCAIHQSDAIRLRMKSSIQWGINWCIWANKLDLISLSTCAQMLQHYGQNLPCTYTCTINRNFESRPNPTYFHHSKWDASSYSIRNYHLRCRKCSIARARETQ